jgi:hypothetical protein
MNRHAPVPTLLQRQALATYNAVHRDATYQAERVRVLHRAVAPAMAPPTAAQPEPCQFCAAPEADTDAPLPMMLFSAAIGLVAWGVFGWIVVTLIDALRAALGWWSP